MYIYIGADTEDELDKSSKGRILDVRYNRVTEDRVEMLRDIVHEMFLNKAWKSGLRQKLP